MKDVATHLGKAVADLERRVEGLAPRRQFARDMTNEDMAEQVSEGEQYDCDSY